MLRRETGSCREWGPELMTGKGTSSTRAEFCEVGAGFQPLR
jgi:hypothetical protein